MYAAQTRATAIRDTWSEASILRSMLGTRGRRPAMGHAWRVYDGDPDRGTA